MLLKEYIKGAPSRIRREAPCKGTYDQAIVSRGPATADCIAEGRGLRSPHPVAQAPRGRPALRATMLAGCFAISPFCEGGEGRGADTIDFMRWIYLSPHPDDAALCAGGLIYDQVQGGEQVEIWTLMAGVPEAETLSDYARKMHAKWATEGVRETMALRREEDRRAAAVLGARPVHFDFADALYRRGLDGEPLYGNPVQAPVSPVDASLPDKLAAELRTRLRPDDRLVCLLGIGDHVDHVLVRRAAEMLDTMVLYVADMPYVLRSPESVPAKTVGLVPRVRPVSAAGVEAWLAAVAAYGSQLASLREMWDALFEGVRERCAREGGVRVWVRSGGPP